MRIGERLRRTVALLAMSIIFIAGAVFMAAPASADVGGLDMVRACKAQFSVGAVVTARTIGNGPYDWRCSWMGMTLSYWGVDTNRACRQQYGNTAYSFLAANNVYGWRCYYMRY